MIDIVIKGNYIYLTNTDNNIVTDRLISDISIVKKYSNSTQFSVYYKGSTIDDLYNIEWDSFTLDGVAFASITDFEDFKNENTGTTSTSGGGGTGGNTTIDTVETVEREVQLFGATSNPDTNIYSDTFTLPANTKAYAFLVQEGTLEKVNEGVDPNTTLAFTDPVVTYQTGAGSLNGDVFEKIVNTSITFTAIGDNANIIIKYKL